MAAGTYELWLTDDSGAKLASLDTALGWTAAKVANRVAGCALNLPAGFDTALITRPDRMIRIWRNGRLWQIYLVRRWRFEKRAGRSLFSVWGVDPKHLLTRRHVIAYSGAAQSVASNEEADDLMKRIVTEALADGVAPTPDAGTRALAGLSVQGNTTAGPQVSLRFAYKQLLDNSGGGVLSDIADVARTLGTEVFFDVVPSSVRGDSVAFQFRTTTGQPGVDRTVTNGVTFSLDNNNIVDPAIEFDHTAEVNYVYAGGQNDGAARVIAQAYSASRYRESIWNRCEGFADARNQDTAARVLDKARSELNAGRPRIKFTATPLSVAGARFGVDWDYGDRVPVSFMNYEFTSIIRAVTLTVAPGSERIDARLEYEQ